MGTAGQKAPLGQATGRLRVPAETCSVGGAGHMFSVLKEWTELRQPHIHGNRLRTNLIPRWGLFVSREKVDKGGESKRSRGRAMRAEVADARPVSAAPRTKQSLGFFFPHLKYQWTFV